jgi:two-component system heavy metal sensor histidine kinase CusS
LKSVSLTARLTVLFASASVGVLLLGGLLLSRAVERHFLQQDMQEIAGKIERVRGLISTATSWRALEALRQQMDDALIGYPMLVVIVAGKDGSRWFASSGDALPRAVLKDPPSGENNPVQWSQGGRVYRGVTVGMPTAIPGEAPLTVAIALDITPHMEFMSKFHMRLWGAIAVAVGVMALLGWVVARSGLRPLRKVVSTIATVTGSRLTQRLDESGVPGELTDLVSAFNAMLDRLEDSFRRLSDFSSDIAHELRTPVSNLMTQTDVALSRARSAEEYRAVLHSSLEEYERMARMIRDMLFLAKADNGMIAINAGPIDLTNEVQELFEFYGALAEESGVRLAVSGGGTLEGDKLMLRRAVNNMLSNALRHSLPGGTVSVRIERHDRGVIEIAVENTGEDIPPKHLPRLFDRFYRVDLSRQRNSEGAGLGLAITKSIVEAHGGSVAVESREGRTCFSVKLPVRPTNANSNEASRSQPRHV